MSEARASFLLLRGSQSILTVLPPSCNPARAGGAGLSWKMPHTHSNRAFFFLKKKKSFLSIRFLPQSELTSHLVSYQMGLSYRESSPQVCPRQAGGCRSPSLLPYARPAQEHLGEQACRHREIALPVCCGPGRVGWGEQHHQQVPWHRAAPRRQRFAVPHTKAAAHRDDAVSSCASHNLEHQSVPGTSPFLQRVWRAPGIALLGKGAQRLQWDGHRHSRAGSTHPAEHPARREGCPSSSGGYHQYVQALAVALRWVSLCFGKADGTVERGRRGGSSQRAAAAGAGEAAEVPGRGRLQRHRLLLGERRLSAGKPVRNTPVHTSRQQNPPATDQASVV